MNWHVGQIPISSVEEITEVDKYSTTPTNFYEWTNPGPFMGLKGDYIISTYDNGADPALVSTDISTADSPSYDSSITIGTTGSPTKTVAFGVEGNYCYAVLDNDYFYVIDITDPTSMSVSGSVTTSDLQYTQLGSEIFVVGNYAFVTLNKAPTDTHNNILVFDCSTKSSPSLHHSFSFTLTNTQQRPSKFDDDTLVMHQFGSFSQARMTTVDISSPGSLSTLDTVSNGLKWWPQCAGVSDGTHLFVPTGKSSVLSGDGFWFTTVDMSDTSNISNETNNEKTEFYDDQIGVNVMNHVTKGGDYAFCTHSYGVSIVDISDMTNPRLISVLIDGDYRELTSSVYKDGYLYAHYYANGGPGSDSLITFEVSGI